jgi:uncharacterized membrane protein YbaN (DUF454 family)
MSRIVGLVLGYFFLLLGIAGLVLPVLQGWLFIAIGLIILSRHAAWARRVLDWLRDRHPKVAHAIDRAERWVTDKGRRLRVRTGRLFRPAAR